MMSAQMLSAASNVSGTVADLAPGAKDGMRMLEAKAAEMACDGRTGPFHLHIYFNLHLMFS
jgi:pre-mRNA-splicing factor SYF1